MSGGGATGRPRAVVARAGTNIALVKYWGKRDADLNLPATGSLSLTLGGLGTETRVAFARGSADSGGRESDGVAGSDRADRVHLGGAPADAPFSARVSRFLDLVRERAGLDLPAEVDTRNSVPTAAGLASSASGFAALALAASRAAGLTLAPADLSALARRGSGSAARSIFGGFVEMARGERPDGRDAVARPLLHESAWAVRLVVALTSAAQKEVGSTLAMERTARTSPYYAAWVEAAAADLDQARAAVLARDLPRLGAVAERNALRMHASALGADPPVLYWNRVTLAAVETVRALRDGGTPAWFTIDAGPHVKVLCAEADAPAVAAALAAAPGVLGVETAAPGPGAAIVETVSW